MSDTIIEGTVHCPWCKTPQTVRLRVTKIVPEEPVDEYDVAYANEETEESKEERYEHYRTFHPAEFARADS